MQSTPLAGRLAGSFGAMRAPSLNPINAAAKARPLTLLAACMLVGGTANAADKPPDLTSNLVGYWPMNESSGTNVPDVSGNGFDGTTLHDPGWSAGRSHNCLTFSGPLNQGLQTVSGGMKVVERWRFEYPFSSRPFSSNPSLQIFSSFFRFRLLPVSFRIFFP